MALKFIEGFGQFQGQVGSQLLASLTAAGYRVSQGVALSAGRHADSYALEMQVSAGAAGTTWSSRVNGIKSTLRAAAYGSGRWVVVGDNGVIYTSTNTIDWVPCANALTAGLLDVAYANGMWIAVGNASVILTSTDGQNWTQRTAPAGLTLRAVAFGNDRWTVVGAAGTAGAIITSTDGISWGSLDGGTYPNNDVLYHENVGWVVVGNTGQVRTSQDGLTFTAGAYGASGNIASVAYDGETLVAVAGTAFRQSINGGTTWSAGAQISTYTIASLATAGGLWVAVGSSGAIFTSDDLITWTKRAGTGTQAFYGVAVSTGAQAAWIAVGAVYGSVPNNLATLFVSMAPPTTISRTFHSAATRVVLGFAHRANARGRIASITGVCDIDWPAGIEILGTAGNAVPIRNAWYYYELTIDKTSQTISLHINDTADITVAMPPAVAEMTEYVVTWQVENGAVGRVNDIYFLDNSTDGGAALTSRLKPIRVPVRFPTADELSEWSSTEAGAHWTVVGLPPPANNRYLHSSTSGAQELFSSTDALPDGAGTAQMPILAVGLVALASKSDLDNRQLGMVVGQGAGQKEVVETSMSMDPKYSYAVFEKAPGNVTWDAANVVSTPFGVVVRP